MKIKLSSGDIINKFWYNYHPLRWLLVPFSCIYQLVVAIRRFFLQQFCQQLFAVPIIVVGNLSVGGVGKTPLVIALAHKLSRAGIRVGIVSRGYGASIGHFPYEVSPDDEAAVVGDEPLLLARRTGCPVVIAPKRTQAVQYLLDKYQCHLIISDDGLQHYKMGRALEIVVIDGKRGLGNGLCLPAGPLREGVKRLRQADFVVVNSGKWPNAYQMNIIPEELTQLTTRRKTASEQLKGSIAAVAAIGNPQRFFDTLDAMGLSYTPYSFADHHCFQPEEFCFTEDLIIMTEKDAVKCTAFATDKMYFLPVHASVDDKFWQKIWSHKQLQGCINEANTLVE